MGCEKNVGGKWKPAKYCKFYKKTLIVVCLIFFTLVLYAGVFSVRLVPFVLESNFPITVKKGYSYPQVLQKDVSSLLPVKLKDIANSRFSPVPKTKGPMKLLSVHEYFPNCAGIIQGKDADINYASTFMQHITPDKVPISKFSMNSESECREYVSSRGYIDTYTQEEEDFPIAYSIMMYRDVDQVERLLRAIYRPTNQYCIHVDAKASGEIQTAMKNIVSCFPNVMLSSRQNDVQWATFASLTPVIYCMSDMWKNKKWKYFINLTGQEFPLKTNLQLIKILKALDGANVVDVTEFNSYKHRWYENLAAPAGITPHKGLVFIAASRGFVNYTIHDPVAKNLLDWVKYTNYPDETYFSTLNHNPHLKVPGSYKGDPETDAIKKPFIGRFVNWGEGWKDSQYRLPYSWPCGGHRVRGVCVFGIRDLSTLTNRRELFANKFDIKFEPVAYDCLEQWLFNLTLVEYAGIIDFDTSWYRSLDIVLNKIS